MARPGSGNPKRGRGTSFGKKSEAEKAFRRRKPGNRFTSRRDDQGDSRDARRGQDRSFSRNSAAPHEGGFKKGRPGSKGGFKGPGKRGFERPRRENAQGGPESRTEAKNKGFRSGFGEKRPFSRDKKSFIRSRVVTSADFTRPSKKEIQEPKENDGLIRLNKYIANAGVGSRRQADELIKMGVISVNGTVVTTLGTKVKLTDEVRYDDKILKAERLVYILLNKPKGFITTTDDPQDRNTVMNIVSGACKERIYPVGRLDRNTTGLLLLTNDGELADKLTHPSYNAKKIYKIELDKPLTKNDLKAITEGVQLEEGRAMVDDIAILSDDHKSVGLEIHIGWNRVVRRIFETLGYQVVKLDRSVYAGLDKKDLSRGQWRFLKPEEVVRLKHFK